MTSCSNQVALLSAVTALTKVVHDHLITKFNGCFSGLTLLDLSGAHDTTDCSCIPETLSFLGFCDTICFWFSFTCLFPCKFLFLFYTLNILVFLGFGPSPQSSFLSSTFLGQSQPLSWHYHTYLNIRPTPAFFQHTIISWGSHLIFWPLKSPWITKCSLGEDTLACNDLIQCSYRSHLTELVRKERRKFNTDIEISSREIPSHLQIFDVLVNKPLKDDMEDDMIVNTITGWMI